MESTTTRELAIPDEASWTELDGRYRPGLISSIRARAATFGLTREGHVYVRAAAVMPSRRVRSTPKSSSGTYPSRKLGVAVAFESRTLELPTVTTLENDDDVIGYFDQPPRSVGGRRISK